MRSLTLLCTCLALGCGDLPEYTPQSPGESDSDFYRGPSASYNLECKRVTCDSPDDTSKFQTDTYQSFTCVWHCADYDGDARQYVSLTFEAVDGCWTIGSEYVSSGLCD